MTKNLDKDGFCSIVDNYQLFYIDLWGVIHNGINLHKDAIKVLKEISKKVILCSESKLIQAGDNEDKIKDFGVDILVVVAYGKSIVVGEISKHFDAVGLHIP